ncbi:MAG: 3-methylcrotonyl-CoA carboxylase alpha subunit, partial [Pseudomonadota bacterium]|nr:3-methylcrotonyl-CoA carboxylase alpha subunit [Pseudomonadota bacterium]
EAAAGEPDSPWSVADGWRLNLAPERRITLRCGEQTRTVGAQPDAAGGWWLSIGDTRLQASGRLGPDGMLAARLGERRVQAAVVVSGERRQVFLDGRSWPVLRVARLQAGRRGDEHGGGLKAPMPGKVIALLATPGTGVEAGTPLLVMEAMKMEHTLTAPTCGRLLAFRFAVGDTVSDGAELVDFAAQAPGAAA